MLVIPDEVTLNHVAPEQAPAELPDDASAELVRDRQNRIRKALNRIEGPSRRRIPDDDVERRKQAGELLERVLPWRPFTPFESPIEFGSETARQLEARARKLEQQLAAVRASFELNLPFPNRPKDPADCDRLEEEIAAIRARARETRAARPKVESSRERRERLARESLAAQRPA